ncbi:MAG TPA: hypothetical protein PLA96_11670, partial [Candidatus Brocadia sapporoensis]|uniref:hypothetical protein n=1 Tax=Candidatus Brocadia sapporoensis TaxID=392547 RepID=UPI001E45454C
SIFCSLIVFVSECTLNSYEIFQINGPTFLDISPNVNYTTFFAPSPGFTGFWLSIRKPNLLPDG